MTCANFFEKIDRFLHICTIIVHKIHALKGNFHANLQISQCFVSVARCRQEDCKVGVDCRCRQNQMAMLAEQLYLDALYRKNRTARQLPYCLH